MERSWLIDSKGIATKVKCSGLSPANQLKDCGARRKCPKCRYIIDNSDVFQEWPGFPAGVKFDPSDIELLEHLATKCGVGRYEPHMFIDEFIPTIDKEGGICLCPSRRSSWKDGSSSHFFHRTTNAYASGQRKRRKIQRHQNNLTSANVRWHKTGKTRSVIENGVHKGYKKIMVLYRITKKGSKPDKANWVMHQYHLGTDEDEPEGQFLVSKIFYQKPRLNENNSDSVVMAVYDLDDVRASPRTPKTNVPNPPRPGVTTSNDDFKDEKVPQSSKEEPEFLKETPQSSSIPEFTDNVETQTWLAGESQSIDDTLLCDENLNSHLGLDDFALNNDPLNNSIGRFTNDISGPSRYANNGSYDLENLVFGTLPDFHLKDLPFDSQEDIFSWLDRL